VIDVRSMHVKAHLLDNIGNVGAGESKILQGSHIRWDRHMSVGRGTELLLSVNWSSRRVARSHVSY
jgi:hypothetical protein